MQELQLELPALDADDQEPFDSDEELEEIGAGSGELADVIRCEFMRAVAEHSKSVLAYCRPSENVQFQFNVVP